MEIQFLLRYWIAVISKVISFLPENKLRFRSIHSLLPTLGEVFLITRAANWNNEQPTNLWGFRCWNYFTYQGRGEQGIVLVYCIYLVISEDGFQDSSAIMDLWISTQCISPAPSKLRQKNCFDFEASPGYVMRAYLKRKNKKTKTNQWTKEDISGPLSTCWLGNV